jgi:hypothetical protein
VSLIICISARKENTIKVTTKHIHTNVNLSKGSENTKHGGKWLLPPVSNGLRGFDT